MAAHDRWERYEAWNDAIANVVYSPSAAGQPVYLDLEEDILAAAAVLAGAVGDPRDELLSAVRATLLWPRDHLGWFGDHLGKLRRWRSSSGEPPPTIALLAVLSLAAEDMREGEGFASNNYYERLLPLIGFGAEHKDRVINKYREHSAFLWEGLNRWLEDLRGERGLPTAFAWAHQHVGRPLSQALIRAGDREKLAELFADLGLEAHARLSPEDMEAVLSEWVNRNPSPASGQIRAMWKRSGARGRIVEIACAALEGWEPAPGTSTTACGSGIQARRARSLSLLARLRSFPTSILELNVLGPALDAASQVALVGADGELTGTDLAIESIADGRWRLATGDLIEPKSLLEGMLRVRHPAGRLIEHRPRRVVPLRADAFVQGFVETERLGLGEDALVLVQSTLTNQLVSALNQVARPGHRLVKAAGLPDGWDLVAGVQVLSPLATAAAPSGQWPLDFNVLQPLASSQLVLAGGMQLPGRLHRWSSLAPPELRVASDASDLKITIEAAGEEGATALIKEFTFAKPIAVVDLGDLALADGDYEVRAVGNASSSRSERSIGTVRMRLRSADRANPLPTRALGRWADDAMAAVTALEVEPDDARTSVCGPAVAGPRPKLMRAPPPVESPGWWTNRKASPRERAQPERRLVLADADPSDCFRTGSHILVLPTFYGKTNQSTVEGVCRLCGLVKRFPARYRESDAVRGRPRQAAPPPSPMFRVSSLPAAEPTEGIDANTALDALSHDRAGRAGWLEQLALQVDPSQLFVDRFTRCLDALGHIDVALDPSDLRPTSWHIAPPSLVELADGAWCLVGARSRSLVSALVAEKGFNVEIHAVPGEPASPDVITARPNAELALDVAVRRIGKRAGLDQPLQIVRDAAADLASCLPPVSAVVAARSTTAMPGTQKAKRWDTATARWKDATSVAKAGAYQLQGSSTTYWWRGPSDDAQFGTRLDARLVKFMAAAGAGECMLGYERRTKTLFVPLGADLPGLYARAAVLASGRPPEEDLTQRVLRYHDIPATLAGRLAAVLAS